MSTHSATAPASAFESREVLEPKDYNVLWFAPLHIEARAALELLDNRHHGRFPVERGMDYVFLAGDSCGHNIIIATLPPNTPYGTGAAARIASQAKQFFPNLWFGLLVGVAAGIPNLSIDEPLDIRLGDIIVGEARGDDAGIIAYDLGKETAQDGFQLLRRGHALATTETLVLSAIGSIQLDEERSTAAMLSYYEKIKDVKRPGGTFADPGQDKDVLNEVDDDGKKTAIRRERRPDSDRTRVWYGPIGSGEKLMKNARIRNELRDKYNIIGLEMEAAGTINVIHVGVIRGVCDYGDEEKNKVWQPYAAAMAAAYAKVLLTQIPTRRDEESRKQYGKYMWPLLRSRADVCLGGMNNGKRKLSETTGHVVSGRSKRPCLGDPDSQSPQVITDEHPAGLLNEEQKRILWKSLAFDQIDARHNNIKQAHGKTCGWLLENTEYVDWLDPNKLGEHHGFLWIKGKPGAGKSTLMKFILRKARQKLKGTIVSFFFNARGSDLEKSTIGMYRSLLFQIFEKLPHLQNIFDSLGYAARNESTPQWSIELLKTLFEHVVQSLGKHAVVCFIDALDECDEKQIREMMRLFESLGKLATSQGILFRACFSSRHYPNISISNGITLDIVEQAGHYRDIVSYLDDNLDLGRSKLAEEIRAKTIQKASGVFMWIYLVVPILRTAFEDGHLHKLKSVLQKIPKDLHDLFRRMLTRDNQHKDELLLCIQWILFAKNPLTPAELCHAVLFGTADVSDIAKLNHDELEESNINKYILSSSKGLAEVTRSKKSRTVQFIHESVRDFLLKKDGLREIWPECGENIVGGSHERLKQVCISYMKFDHYALTIDPSSQAETDPSSQAETDLSSEGETDPSSQSETDLSSERETDPPSHVEKDRETAGRAAPFLQYAVRNVLYHADAAGGGGVSQADFIQNFLVPEWIELSNIFEKKAIRQHTSEPSLLYLLAEYDASNLISCHPDKLSCFDVEGERDGSPFLAALANGSRRAVWAFLKAQADTQPSTSPVHALCEEYRQSQDKWNGIGRHFRYSRHRGLLSHVAGAGDEFILNFLLVLGKHKDDIESTSREGQTPLMYAAKGGHEGVVRLLLNKGANMEAGDGRRRTPLMFAARGGHEGVVRLLLDNGANIKAKDTDNRKPLGHVLDGASKTKTTTKGHEATMKLLLDRRADTESGCEFHQGTPLTVAVEKGLNNFAGLLLEANANIQGDGGRNKPLLGAVDRGNTPLVRLLLDKGAYIEAADYSGQTPLLRAASGYDGNGTDETLVSLLLDKGANIEAADERGKTPLLRAAASVHDIESTLQLLLDKGAKIKAADVDGRTALSWAVSPADRTACNETTVQQLLLCGMEVDVADKKGRTPLSWAAAFRGSEIAIQLLRDHGANIEAADENGRTALSWAAFPGRFTACNNTAVQQLLLYGAKVDVADKNGRTPLSWAAANCERDSEIGIQLLLDKGANIEAADNDGRTPLSWAASDAHRRHSDLNHVNVLLDHGARIDTVDKNGKSPLDYFEKEGDKEAVLQRIRDKAATVEVPPPLPAAFQICIPVRTQVPSWTRNGMYYWGPYAQIGYQIPFQLENYVSFEEGNVQDFYNSRGRGES